MNIFYIPSWYPSVPDPLTGSFFRDQALDLSKNYPEVQIGISTWGQNDDRLLLWSSRPLRSIQKIIHAEKTQSAQKDLCHNATEFFSPSFTWSWKIKKGNIQNIIEANLKNLRSFEARSGKTDVIHAHVAFPAGYIAMKLSGITGIPYLITEHMSPFPFKYFGGGRQLAKRVLEPYHHSAVNIAVSQQLKEKMQKHGIPDVRVVYNSVDENLFTLPDRKIPSRPFIFFTLGRMVSQKGIDILLRAVNLIQPGNEILFRIGGDGEELGKYQSLATELGIDNRVQWLGSLTRRETALEMKNCHAFVLPSRHESMGIVFAEAIACGKPVIGTHCGGPEEIINDHNGLLIPPEDLDALANAIRQLRVQYTQFDAKTIRAGFMNRFSSKVITAQIIEIYEEICGSEISY